MTKAVTLRQADGSVSATLPKDMAGRLRLEAGDRVLTVETDRGILLTPYAPETERALKVAAKAAEISQRASSARIVDRGDTAARAAVADPTGC